MSNEKQVVETLKDLSWKKFKDLSDLLNVEHINFGWKSLMATFDFYKPQHVSTFNREKNPAESVLMDLKSRMVKVDDLYVHLHQMGHKEAMSVIVDCVSPHVVVETKESMVVAQQESPHLYEDAIPLQPGGVIMVSSEQPLLLPPAPPPPSKDLQECEADLSVSRMNIDWILKETSQLQQNCIGGGCYGLSYKITPPGGGAKVLVKKLSSEVDYSALPRLCHLDNVHLAKVIGYLRPQKENMYYFLVREFVRGLSLDSLLRHLDSAPPAKNEVSWPMWRNRLGLAKGVASGLDYLHSKSCCHGNLKSRNIIVVDGVPKMTDYAVAKGPIQTCTVEGSKRETESYTAPEVTRSGVITSASDVFAYGKILLELLTGKVNFDQKREGPKELYGCLEALIEDDDPDKFEVAKVSCKKASWPQEISFDVFSFACLCLRHKPSQRPGMNEMVDQLNAL